MAETLAALSFSAVVLMIREPVPVLSGDFIQTFHSVPRQAISVLCAAARCFRTPIVILLTILREKEMQFRKEHFRARVLAK